MTAAVDQERIDAAVARIKRTVEYLDTIAADSALDLLNPEVHLA